MLEGILIWVFIGVGAMLPPLLFRLFLRRWGGMATYDEAARSQAMIAKREFPTQEPTTYDAD